VAIGNFEGFHRPSTQRPPPSVDRDNGLRGRFGASESVLGRADGPASRAQAMERSRAAMRAQMTVSDSKDDHVDTATPRPPRGSGLYTATWAVLAVTATGYIGALLLEPEWAAPLITQSLRAEEPSPATPELVEQLTGEVNSLRETIANLERELTEVKAKAAAREVEIINQQKRAEIDPPQAPEEQEPVTAELQQEEAEMLGPVEAAQIETASLPARGDSGLRATDSEPTHSDVSLGHTEAVEQPADTPTLAAAEEPQERQQPPIEILAVKRKGAEDEPGAAVYSR